MGKEKAVKIEFRGGLPNLQADGLVNVKWAVQGMDRAAGSGKSVPIPDIRAVLDAPNERKAAVRWKQAQEHAIALAKQEREDHALAVAADERCMDCNVLLVGWFSTLCTGCSEDRERIAKAVLAGTCDVEADEDLLERIQRQFLRGAALDANTAQVLRSHVLQNERKNRKRVGAAQCVGCKKFIKRSVGVFCTKCKEDIRANLATARGEFERAITTACTEYQRRKKGAK